MQFRCSARYVTHGPTDLGASVSVRLRLGPDCGVGGSVPSERPPIGGSSTLLRAVRLEEVMPGEVAVTLEWAKTLNYVLAPTTDGRGFRVRLLDAVGGKRGRMTVNDQADPLSGYAINLESSTTPITRGVAGRGIGVPEAAEPTSRRSSSRATPGIACAPARSRAQKDAERALLAAQQRYPRAWIGINDETASAARRLGRGRADRGADDSRSTRAMPEAERKALLDNARSAMSKRDYPRAIELLTKLTAPARISRPARAQELLGLARERAGQLAHAKAEYGEYLRRYPDGDAAPRLRQRMRLLSSAGRRGRSGHARRRRRRTTRAPGGSPAVPRRCTAGNARSSMRRRCRSTGRARTRCTPTATSSRGGAASASTSSRASTPATPRT